MPPSARRDLLDLALPCVAAGLAALALLLPDGSGLRMALALPLLLFVPGHLLIAAVAPWPATARRRLVRACVAVGVSPPIVGLLALSTTLLPGGFRASSIVAVVTAACLALAGAAAWRRRSPRPARDAAEGEAVAT